MRSKSNKPKIVYNQLCTWNKKIPGRLHWWKEEEVECNERKRRLKKKLQKKPALSLHTWHYCCPHSLLFLPANLCLSRQRSISVSCLEQVWVTWTTLSRGSFGSQTCVPWTFKIISICSDPPRHPSSPSSVAVRRQRERVQGVNGFNLVLFLPSSLFPFSLLHETFQARRSSLCSTDKIKRHDRANDELMHENINRLSKYTYDVSNILSENLWDWCLWVR